MSGAWRVLRRGYIRDLRGGGRALGVSIDEGKAKGVRGFCMSSTLATGRVYKGRGITTKWCEGKAASQRDFSNASINYNQ